MARCDLRSNVKVSELYAAAAVTSDANSAAVDMQGFESLVIMGVFGAEGDTLSGSVYTQLELEESDDNSTFTDVAAADMLGEVGAANGLWTTINVAADASNVYTVAYTGSKRYVRCVINVTGTHSNGTITGIYALQGHPSDAPVSQPTANAAV